MSAAEWEAAGLYDPAAPNAAERLELLEWLAGRGVTLDAMVGASRERSITGLAGDLLLERGHRHYTLAQIVDETATGPITSPGSAFLTPPTSLDLASFGYVEEEFVAGTATSYTSAFRLVTYVDAIHPVARVYDGFLVHSRGASGAALSEPPQATIATPPMAFIRTDIDVPVLTLETETDLITLGFFPARQPDDRHVRLWEIAGTAHDDVYGLAAGPDDPGPAALDTTYLPPVTSIFGVITCSGPINAGPHGASAPRLDIDPGPPAALRHDPFGNVLGGIRTPQVDVPIATLSGLGQSGGGFCALFGTTTPFDVATLATLYPSHTGYVAAIADAARKAVHAGVVLKADRPAIIQAAMASTIGSSA